MDLLAHTKEMLVYIHEFLFFFLNGLVGAYEGDVGLYTRVFVFFTFFVFFITLHLPVFGLHSLPFILHFSICFSVHLPSTNIDSVFFFLTFLVFFFFYLLSFFLFYLLVFFFFTFFVFFFFTFLVFFF